MNRNRSDKEIQRFGQAKRRLLFFLLSLFLVTTCPVKKSISLMLFDKAGIENFGLNDQKTAGENQGLKLTRSVACSAADMANPANTSLHAQKVPSPFFPISLGFLFLLPAGYFKTLLRPGTSGYFEKFAFPAALTPIYIRHRRLLI